MPSLTKLEIILVFVIGVLIVLAVMWGYPSYKSQESRIEKLQTEKTALQRQLDTNSVTRTYYPTGKIASETIASSHETVHSSSDTSTAEKDYSKTVTKRGTVSIGLLFGDSYIPKAGYSRTTIIGPVGLGAYVNWSNGFAILAGPELSF